MQNITYTFTFELLLKKILSTYIWRIVQLYQKKKRKYVVEQRSNEIYSNQSFLFIS